MKNPDTVLRELGQLYDFNKEIARFRIRKTEKPAGSKIKHTCKPNEITVSPRII